jgi:hypothetical protein
MRLQESDLPGIQRMVNQVKRQSPGAVVTNYFPQLMRGDKFLVTTSSHSVVFANKDMDFFRLYFYTSSIPDLAAVLRLVELDSDLVIAYYTRALDVDLQAAFFRAGFRSIATFARTISNHVPDYRTNDKLCYAEPADLDTLHARLLHDFDKYVDYLPDKQLLRSWIEQKQVLLNRGETGIRGYMIFQISGKVCHANYLFNSGGAPGETRFLLQNFDGVLNERGVKRIFGWVNVENTHVIEMHARFGRKRDGLLNYFYLREAMREGVADGPSS